MKILNDIACNLTLTPPNLEEKNVVFNSIQFRNLN